MLIILYKGLIALLRDQIHQTHELQPKPRTTPPITQEITTIKTQEKGFSLGFSKKEPLRIDVLRSFTT
jgi:hypothetical protein